MHSTKLIAIDSFWEDWILLRPLGFNEWMSNRYAWWGTSKFRVVVHENHHHSVSVISLKFQQQQFISRRENCKGPPSWPLRFGGRLARLAAVLQHLKTGDDPHQTPPTHHACSLIRAGLDCWESGLKNGLGWKKSTSLIGKEVGTRLFNFTSWVGAN